MLARPMAMDVILESTGHLQMDQYTQIAVKLHNVKHTYYSTYLVWI